MSVEAPTIPALPDAPLAVDDKCSPLDRIAIVLGGSAAGAGLGFIATMTTGVLDPHAAAIYGAPIYVVSLYLAYGGWRDAAELGRWRSAAPALLFIAVSAWPAAVLLSPEVAPPVWPVTVLVLSAISVLTESARTHSVFRSSWLISLTTILAANQATQALLGR